MARLHISIYAEFNQFANWRSVLIATIWEFMAIKQVPEFILNALFGPSAFPLEPKPEGTPREEDCDQGARIDGVNAAHLAFGERGKLLPHRGSFSGHGLSP